MLQQAIMEAAQHEWDRNEDGMIENSSAPDQTYDAWTMTGVRCRVRRSFCFQNIHFSAYCGALWLAALQACRRMATLLQDTNAERHYELLLSSARNVFIDKLWTGACLWCSLHVMAIPSTGDYYKFDEDTRAHGCIMSDQLCGVWYLSMCRFDDALEVYHSVFIPLTMHFVQLLPPMDVLRCLSTIFSANVMGVKDGRSGAVNGYLVKYANA